jgi:hypothetical protein
MFFTYSDSATVSRSTNDLEASFASGSAERRNVSLNSSPEM